MEDPLPSRKRRCLFPSASQQKHQRVKQCCGKNCLVSIPQERISTVRYAFQSRTQGEQRQFLMDCFQLTEDSTTLTHHIAGQQVCSNAFIEILGISRRRYRRMHKQVSMGCSRSVRKPPIRTVTEETPNATALYPYVNLTRSMLKSADNYIGQYLSEAQKVSWGQSKDIDRY